MEKRRASQKAGLLLMAGVLAVFSSFCSCSSWTCGRRVAHAGDDLFFCVKKGDTARVRELMAQGQSPYDRCDGSLYHALGTTTDKHMSDYVLSLPLDIEYETAYGTTAIYVVSGDVLEQLLKKGANPNHLDDDGRTAFDSHVAAAVMAANEEELQKQFNDLDLLIRYGYDINSARNRESLEDTLFNDGDVRKKLLCGVDMSRFYSNKARLIHFLRGRGVRGIHWQ